MGFIKNYLYKKKAEAMLERIGEQLKSNDTPVKDLAEKDYLQAYNKAKYDYYSQQSLETANTLIAMVNSKANDLLMEPEICRDIDLWDSVVKFMCKELKNAYLPRIEYYISIAVYLLDRGYGKSAMSFLNEMKSEDIRINFLRGMCNYGLGNSEKAINLLAKCDSTLPNDNLMSARVALYELYVKEDNLSSKKLEEELLNADMSAGLLAQFYSILNKLNSSKIIEREKVKPSANVPVELFYEIVYAYSSCGEKENSKAFAEPYLSNVRFADNYDKAINLVLIDREEERADEIQRLINEIVTSDRYLASEGLIKESLNREADEAYGMVLNVQCFTTYIRSF